MAELSLKQIEETLNAEFTGDARKLVFWYDEKAEFVEDIALLQLQYAEILILEPDNQFSTKYFLERVDRENHYLLYAPFPKPALRENHLADMLLYSKEFFADRASLLLADLGIDPKYKPLIQKYGKFFAAKDRSARFYEIRPESYSSESIEMALLGSLVKSKVASFDEVLRMVLTEGELMDNRLLAEFEKYDLLDAFWRYSEEKFGYSDPSPTLENLLLTLFVTYTQRVAKEAVPKAWHRFISHRTGNAVAFLDSLMNSVVYRVRFGALSRQVAASLQVKKQLEKQDPAAFVSLDLFEAVDEILLQWVRDRLLEEDLNAVLDGHSIPEICRLRRRAHFAESYRSEYHLLESAFHSIGAVKYEPASDFHGFVRQYREKDFWIDQQYRKFYFNYDRLQETASFETLRELVENIYTNVYLEESIYSWNTLLQKEPQQTALPSQRNFFAVSVQPRRERVVVIVSDAMRYEVGQALFAKLENDEKCTPKLDAMLGVLPSITRMGMGALLPHRNLEWTADNKILVDGVLCDTLKQREAVLRSYVPNSRCIQFDDLVAMKKMEMREVFTGMEVVYVYHDQIDARGDKANTENEVFQACAEAVDEVYAMIKRIAVNANTLHFIVTSDHGFVYKRDKLHETDKTVHGAGSDDTVNRRFILTKEELSGEGVLSYSLGTTTGREDERKVFVPVSSNVFKVPGGGQNYVHGGSSPQEMILPLIDVKVEKGYTETAPAKIALVSMVQKVTNLILHLDFIQSEPVSDIVKETNYKVYFVSEEGERISSEERYFADRKELEPDKRMFRLRFNFKNMQYDRRKLYYLVAVDEKNDLEMLRHSVMMDLAFADDFGFEF